MKLNRDGRDELRGKVKLMIMENVPDGNRVHLSKSLLEDLLFEKLTITEPDGKSEIIKLPVWTGEFLTKIDLSEVDFENVAWSLLTPSTFANMEEPINKVSTLRRLIRDDGHYTLNLLLRQKVSFKDTNAKIDFSKSFEAKNGKLLIYYCDFSGVDLAHSHFENVGRVINSEFVSSNLTLTKDEIANAKFSQVDLSENDLSGICIDGDDMFTGYGLNKTFDSLCTFTHTGVSISFSGSNDQNVRDIIKSMMNSGSLEGCFINGVKVLSYEETIAIKEAKKREYQALKDELLASVVRDISKQAQNKFNI